MTFSILRSRRAKFILIACFIPACPASVFAQDSPPVPAIHGIQTGSQTGNSGSIELVTAVEPATAAKAQDQTDIQVIQPYSNSNGTSTDWQSHLSIGDQDQSTSTETWLSNPPVDQGQVLESDYMSEVAPYQFDFASPFRRYQFYRSEESIFSWLPATGDNLGWLSLESTPYLSTPAAGTNEANQGLTTAINIHWLNGPNDIDLPARVYDFVLGYQKQQSLGPRFSYDIAGSVGVYSDFEDSARDGVRFVSHAVGMAHLSDRFDFVFGVDYLDRDDLAILPVIGFSFRPVRAPGLKIDAVFPRPEITWAADSSNQLYVRGLMGGGSWDIEFPDESNDVVTYRDFQILFGIRRHDDDEIKRWEIGYVFQRQMEFADRADQREFDDAFIIRFVTLK